MALISDQVLISTSILKEQSKAFAHDVYDDVKLLEDWPKAQKY